MATRIEHFFASMAGRIEVHPLAPFDPVGEPTSIGQRWKAWRRRFETYLIALDVKNDAQKRALLLYQAGQETQEIFETLTDSGEDFKTAIDKLDAYFSPKKNVDYETFRFRQASQKNDETIAQFVTRLRKLALHCEFNDVEKEIKAAVIQNCLSKRLRRYALREEDMTLDKILAKACALESSEVQATGMEESHSSGKPSESVHQIRTKGPTFRRVAQKSAPTQVNVCRQCGFSWPHTKGPCPAKGKSCNKCGKLNHFAKMCQSRPHPTVPPKRQSYPQQSSISKPQKHSHVHRVSTAVDASLSSDGSDDEYVFTLIRNQSKVQVPETDVEVNGMQITVMIDTGASTDILDEATFNMVNKDCRIKLQPDSCKIFAYGSNIQLTTLGKFESIIKANDRQVTSTFHVLKGTHGSLLSFRTASNLDLVDVKIRNVTTPGDITKSALIHQYPSVFQGVGKLKDYELKLHIDETVTPVAQSARRIPFHLRKKVSTELKRLEQEGIIEKVDGPTPWISPLVAIPKKNGDVRLCVDMRMPNQAIQRERHPTPTVDDLVDALNGASTFSKLDLRTGYHQLSLAPESRYITTFATHEGLRRYARLNFGTNSASEIFQNVISEQIQNIPGAINISDDIIVYGKSPEEHNTALHAVLKRFDNSGLTLHPDKCEFNKSSLAFFGFVFSADGISPDPEKVKAIHEACPPSSTSEVRSFLGMVTYCAKFIQNFSDITKPLRELTKKNVQFHWEQQHQQAFQEVKDALTSDTVMAYFDKRKQTELTTDASPWGLSAILSQCTPGSEDRRIVAYVSRSLTPVEQRYSQTEREALAIVWAMERLHTYLYGGHFTLLTDCKPVELILNNRKSRPPARIERWHLRLQEYNFSTVHTKGQDNPSDFLSRHPGTSTSDTLEKAAEEYVNFLANLSTPKAMSLEDIKQATKEDAVLQKLMQLIRYGNWASVKKDEKFSATDKDELALFSKVRDELTVTNDIVLRGTRIVVPRTLRQQTLALAHQGHQGIVKTKQLLREKVWYPWIDKEVERCISSCIACQANGPATPPAPLQMTPLPPSPWHTVHIDFCGPFPTGEYLLVIIDAYSRFPEVDIIHSTTAKGTILKLERIFATHGIPMILKSDNGPPFHSREFETYMIEMGITHQRITPLWPQANSEAENFMKPLTKVIRAAHIEQNDWKRELYKFLLNYRATPHMTTGLSPSELLFNRKIKVKLPQMVTATDQNKDQIVRQKDEQAKLKMKQHADTKRRTETSEIEIGDTVLVRQRKKSKFTSKFDQHPFKVVRKKGTMITANRNGKFITRNVSMFKKVHLEPRHFEQTSDDDDDDIDGSDNHGVRDNNHVIDDPITPRRYPRRHRNTTQRYGQNVYDC